jgi:hypothetical protein
MHYQIQEGYITFETGEWQDRSVNMLAANHLPVQGTNLVITREPLPAGVGFAEYLANQKALLAKELAKFKLLADSPDSIDDLPAHFLEFSWDNQGTAMNQMICVIHNNGCVLNLTATVPGASDEATRTTLVTAMKSFKLGQVPIVQEGAAR